jgi:hypothetical protein
MRPAGVDDGTLMSQRRGRSAATVARIVARPMDLPFT